MQFQVPQFIEVEDKIFGPFTFRQFVFMTGGAGFAYLIWRVLPSFFALPIALAIIGFAAALAFMQYNGRPFIVALEAGFFYIIHPKLYLWNNRTKKRVQDIQKNPLVAPEKLYVPKLSDSRLHELAWSLDIKERIAAGIGGAAEREALAQDDPLTRLRTPRETLRALTQS